MKFEFQFIVSDEVPRGTISIVQPASEDDRRRGEAVYAGLGIWINPRKCGVITNIGDDVTPVVPEVPRA